MPGATFAAVFFAGLLGGAHCMAMCGGIVGALGASRKASPAIHLAYSIGRILSYVAAGALAGALGGLLMAREVLPVQLALYAIANVLLIGIGLYLGGWSALIVWLERPGRALWRFVSPLTRRLLPADTPARALVLGSLWGWLPCGMTYSVLALALLGRGAADGAALMAAFGLGTLPNLLAAGMLFDRLRAWTRSRCARALAGLVVVGFGTAGLAHAAWLGDQLRRGIACAL